MRLHEIGNVVKYGFVILAMLAIWLPGVAKGETVYDDAVVWIRGDSDLNGDERIQVGEVVDAFSPIATSAIRPTGWLDGTLSGTPGDFVWTNDVVVCPYTFRTNKHAKSFCFRQSIRSDGGVLPNTIALDSTVASRITSDAWSFHMRFKWHGKNIGPKTAQNNILFAGTSASDASGHGFKMIVVSAGVGTGILKCSIGDTEFMNTSIGNAVRLSSNVWTDVTFTMTSTNVVEWSIMQEGGALVTGSRTPGDLRFRPSPSGNILIGHANVRDPNWGNYETSAAYYNAFIGEVASFAMWNRALSPEDRIRAMAWPNEDIFRIGVANGSSDEFNGEGGVSVAALDPDRGWGSFGGDIAAGESKSIAFVVPTRFDGLPQLLRYCAAAGSASGMLSLSANGESVGEIGVNAGRWSYCMVPARYFVDGETTTLTLTRTDAGASNVKSDAVVLGGSWQEGTVSGNQWENKNATAMEPYYVPDGNFAHFRDAIFAGTQQSVRFDVAEDLSFRYRFKVSCRMQYGKIPADIKVCAYLNGRPIYTEIPATAAWAWVDREFAVPYDALRDGENILTFANEGEDSGATQTYFSFDYLRLLVDKKRKGLILTFK